jgi:PAS domain S-box-containing protein
MKKNERSGLDLRRYWVAFFVFVTLGLIAAGFRYYRFQIDLIRQQQYREISIIAGLKTGYIEQWRAERLADAVKTAKSPFFVKGLEDWLLNPDIPVNRENLRERLYLEQTYNVYSDVFVASTKGGILFQARPRSGSVNVVEKQIIKESLKTGNATLSEPYRSEDGNIYVDAIAPVINREGSPIAMVVFRSDANRFLYPLIRSWPAASRSAETLIVRKDGKDVLFLNDLRHCAGTALTLREPLTETDVPAVQAVLGKKGMFLGKDYRDIEVMADLRHIPRSSWYMVAKVDAAEILAEARYRAGVIFIVVSLFILLVALITAYAYRHRQAKIYKLLYRAERKEKESYELFRTTLYSIGDAVITTDNQGLVVQMNYVAEHLTGRQEAEAQGKPLEEVFHIINEETGKKAANPVEHVLREGRVIGLANHTVLISADGSARPIADSGAPIRGEDGDIIGVVMVFRDQTNERKMLEVLRESEEKYREFFTTSRDSIFITSPSGQWVDFNDASLELFGYASSEELAKTPIAELYERPEARPDFLKLVVDKGYVYQHPIRLRKRDGTVMDTLMTATCTRNKDDSIRAFIGTIHDITSRKRTEEALIASIREKEILLRELHHRVKNNLQIISSLFMLESMHGKGRDIETILNESRDRIRAMAIVHEKLYRTPDIDNIGLKGYITDLANGIISAYPLSPGKLRVRIEMQDISLSINHAIPFGLIVNELFTNAVKHAFPGDAKGEVVIKLEEQPERQTITLTVSDNGTGISDAGYASEPATLGLRLVRILAEEQLKGKMEIEHEKGTTFRIKFKRGELV